MKKFISIFLAVVMMVAISVTAFATELNQKIESATTTVEYTTNATYTITIPAYIVPSETNEEATTYSVTATDVVIEDGKELKTTISYDGIMTDNRGAELEYKLYSENKEINDGDVILTQTAGHPNDTMQIDFIAKTTEAAKYAGVFTDVVTFNFAVDNKTYTAAEIEADEHLYGIGKTKSKYVIAKFNDDYTNVEIFKNGEESDGLMLEVPSPMRNNASTLRTAVIKNGVTSIGGYAFNQCSSLTEIIIPDSVTYIGHTAFNWCSSLTELIIPNSVTTIGHTAFSYCKSLTEITIPDSVTLIDQSTFAFCSSLERITIPDSVTYIGNSAFNWCSSLTEIIIPHSVTHIDKSAFAYCKSLENITIPNSVITIGDYAFSVCSSLKTIKGVSGSYAETWATEKGLTFVALNE